MEKEKTTDTNKILISIGWSISWVNFWLFLILLSNIGVDDVKVTNDYIETRDTDIYETYPDLYCSSDGLLYYARNYAPVFDATSKIKKCEEKNSISYHNGSNYKIY